MTLIPCQTVALCGEGELDADISLGARPDLLEEIIRRVCGSQLPGEWQQLRDSPVGVRPVVVNAGAVKAGKSSLFNALAGCSVFAEGAVRTTVTNQSLDVNGYTLVDTPGLNAYADDTEEAWLAYRQADMVVFVHNLLEGDLNRSEVEFLQALRALWPVVGLAERLLVAGTNLHQVDQAAVIGIKARLQEQMRSALALPAENLILTDAVTFHRGLAQGNERLVELSGVPLLRTRLQALVDRMGGEGRMAGRKAALLQLLETKTDAAREKLAALVKANAHAIKRVEALQQSVQMLRQFEPLEPARYTDAAPGPFTYRLAFDRGAARDDRTYYTSSDLARKAANDAFQHGYYTGCTKLLQRAKAALEAHFHPFLTGEGVPGNACHDMLREVRARFRTLRERVGDGLEPFGYEISFPDLALDDSLLKETGYDRRRYLNLLSNWPLPSPAAYLEKGLDVNMCHLAETGWLGSIRLKELGWAYDFNRAVNALEADLQANLAQAAGMLRATARELLGGHVRQLDLALRQAVDRLTLYLDRQLAEQHSTLADSTRRVDELRQQLADLAGLITGVRDS